MLPQQKTLFFFSLFFLSIFFNFQSTDCKCMQKNANREASRNLIRCSNEFFAAARPEADPENCQCYYHCNYRQEPCYQCCPDGQVYEPKLETCVSALAYRCREQPPPFRCPSRGLFANKENCRKYWDCNQPWGLPIEEACSREQHWDDWAKVCRADSEGMKSSRC